LGDGFQLAESALRHAEKEVLSFDVAAFSIWPDKPPLEGGQGLLGAGYDDADVHYAPASEIWDADGSCGNHIGTKGAGKAAIGDGTRKGTAEEKMT
jgi:hypothetical protein